MFTDVLGALCLLLSYLPKISSKAKEEGKREIAKQSKNGALYSQRQEVSTYPIEWLMFHYLLVHQ